MKKRVKKKKLSLESVLRSRLLWAVIIPVIIALSICISMIIATGNIYSLIFAFFLFIFLIIFGSLSIVFGIFGINLDNLQNMAQSLLYYTTGNSLEIKDVELIKSLWEISGFVSLILSLLIFIGYTLFIVKLKKISKKWLYIWGIFFLVYISLLLIGIVISTFQLVANPSSLMLP